MTLDLTGESNLQGQGLKFVPAPEPMRSTATPPALEGEPPQACQRKSTHLVCCSLGYSSERRDDFVTGGTDS